MAMKYRVMLYMGKTQEQKISLDKTAEDERDEYPGVEVYSGDTSDRYGDVRQMLVIVPFDSGTPEGDAIEDSDPWHGTSAIRVEDFVCEFKPVLSNLPEGWAARSVVVDVKVPRSPAEKV